MDFLHVRHQELCKKIVQLNVWTAQSNVKKVLPCVGLWAAAVTERHEGGVEKVMQAMAMTFGDLMKCDVPS